MPKTRVKDRDSSRRDRKAPGNVLQRTPQPRPANVVLMRRKRYCPDSMRHLFFRSPRKRGEGNKGDASEPVI